MRKNFLNAFKDFVSKSKKTVVTGMMTLGATMALAVPTFAAPATGNPDVDTILTTMEGGFGTAQSAFTYLAIAAIPVTLIVVLFFWLRGKFKQAVSGA